MAKNSRWGQKKATGPAIMLAADSNIAHQLFGGKTLEMVGQELDLADEDVTLGENDVNEGALIIKSLLVSHGGVKWKIPFSNGSNSLEITSLDECMDWAFRTGFKSVVKDGVRQKDANNKPILADGKEGRDLVPYMSFGKPYNLGVDRETPGFAEPVEANEKAIAQ